MLDYPRSSDGGPSQGQEAQARREAIGGWPLPSRPMGIAVSRPIETRGLVVGEGEAGAAD